jgi:uncharacterized Zn finger protein
MCKHIAATLYGIGARLDVEPHLLFGLRKVDAQELIARAGEGDALPQKAPRAGRLLDTSKLADVFGIDLPAVEPKAARKAPANEPKAARKAPANEPKAARKAPAKTAVKRKRPANPRKAKTVAALGPRTGRNKALG